MTIIMTNVRANFMGVLELAFPTRPATIGRVELLKFVASLGRDANGKINQIGPNGLRLHAPSWLTNSNQYIHSRGVYRLPWDEYDAWKSLRNGTATNAQKNGAANAVAVPVVAPATVSVA